MDAHCLFQAAAYTIAHNCVANLSADCQAKARFLCVITLQRLNEEKPPAPFLTGPDS